ncbi:MAG: hypothetical protein LBF76_02500 [Holosporales bacterium]|jgi:hypothetical protein|nr:hypothetical protein [Holosporales bacterium]
MNKMIIAAHNLLCPHWTGRFEGRKEKLGSLEGIFRQESVLSVPAINTKDFPKNNRQSGNIIHPRVISR